jgi:hypothetical protein
MKRVAILQSAYIPWRGYFDIIASVDEFIFYDDVQFSHGDWRNRNKIRTANESKWLTIPVPKKHRIRRNINEVVASDPEWRQDHWNRLSQNYANAPYFTQIAELLAPLYLEHDENLSHINARFIKAICDYLGIATRLSWSWDYPSSPGKSERLVDLCKAAGATVYVSGPAAKSYLDEDLFRSSDIEVEWFSYDQLTPYPQIHGGFESNVSIVDLLFNCGPGARDYIPSLSIPGQPMARST